MLHEKCTVATTMRCSNYMRLSVCACVGINQRKYFIDNVACLLCFRGCCTGLSAMPTRELTMAKTLH